MGNNTDIVDQPVILRMLETIIEADLVKTIMSIPQLTMAERRIALGRALRKGIVQQLAKQLVREEVDLVAITGGKMSDPLAEALLAACELPMAA